jgi:transposase
MIKRNPRREALLLVEWKEGKTAREAAKEAGVPEGTTYYYWKKFGRDPEKANRLAQSLKPPEKLQAQDYAIQMFYASEARQAKATYDSLVSQGKYEEAKSSVEARAALERYMSSKLSAITSLVPVYLSDPKQYEPFIGDVLAEMLQKEKAAGAGDIAAIDNVQKELTGLAPMIPKEDLEIMMLVLQADRMNFAPRVNRPVK